MGVVVTNNNAEPFERKFDGTLIVFPPGERVTVSEDAAAYLFAYGRTDADRARILVRNGWQKSGAQNDPEGPKAALAKLNNFVFNAAAPEPELPKPKKKILASQQAERDKAEDVTTYGNPPSRDPLAPGEPASKGKMIAAAPPEPAPERVPTGIGAMGPNVDAGGNTKVPRGTISIPGRSGPLAPPSGPA